jgi:tRNA(fMet)-specific endonuclease VapC
MSLYVLDTDILSLYQHAHPVVCQNVTNHPANEIATTVITVQEQLFGWYHLLGQTKKPDQLAIVYQSLAETVHFLARWQILSFSEPAILRFEQLVTMKLNIGKMDLRIAAITLEIGGTLVTRNQRDFKRIPGLGIVDWSV